MSANSVILAELTAFRDAVLGTDTSTVRRLAAEAATVELQLAALIAVLVDAEILDLDTYLAALRAHVGTIDVAVARQSPSLAPYEGALVESSVASLTFNGISPTLCLVGTPVAYTLLVKDAGDNPLEGCQDTITWSSTDARLAGVLPAAAAMDSNADGEKEYVVTFPIAGTHVLQAASVEAGITAEADPVRVVRAVTAELPPLSVGVAGTLRVRASDEGDEPSSGLSLSLTFSSSDGSATLPDDDVYETDGNGEILLPITFATAGAQTVTVNVGEFGIDLEVGLMVVAAADVVATIPADVTIGNVGFDITVTVTSDGNPVPGYTTTVELQDSTDPDAVTSSPYTITTDANGQALVHMAFNNGGSQSITAHFPDFGTDADQVLTTTVSFPD